MRIPLARAVSIVGHPVVLLFAAALVAASARGASSNQLWFIGGATVAFGAVVLGFSWLQVRAGRWSHVDASVADERRSLNLFLGALCIAGAAVTWFATHRPQMPLALALSGALIAISLLLSRWVKVSLHAMFAAFATALLWPIAPALVAGAAITAAVVWSRLVLGRHVVADVVAGLMLGVAAGAAFHFSIARVFVDDADALVAEFKAKGVRIPRDIRDQPYGCRDFDVEDCNGYRLCFGHTRT